jgi:RsiW-degrading membrane proteinase PrsW (M82 family)
VWFVIIGWAVIEEMLKYGASYYAALRKRENDEPIDALIYLITAALGFAALENTLFLSGTLKTGGIIEGVNIGVLRFVGASLLHVVTSGFIGFCIALAFYKARAARRLSRVLGILGAIALHTLFNFYILKTAGDAQMTFTVFAFVWLAIILLLVGFEKVKQLRH